MASVVAQRKYWLLIEACKRSQNFHKLEEALREFAGVRPAQLILVTSQHLPPSIHTNNSRKQRPFLAFRIPAHSGTLLSIVFIFNISLDRLSDHLWSDTCLPRPRPLAFQDQMYHHFVSFLVFGIFMTDWEAKAGTRISRIGSAKPSATEFTGFFPC